MQDASVSEGMGPLEDETCRGNVFEQLNLSYRRTSTAGRRIIERRLESILQMNSAFLRREWEQDDDDIFLDASDQELVREGEELDTEQEPVGLGGITKRPDPVDLARPTAETEAEQDVNGQPNEEIRIELRPEMNRMNLGKAAELDTGERSAESPGPDVEAISTSDLSSEPAVLPDSKNEQKKDIFDAIRAAKNIQITSAETGITESNVELGEKKTMSKLLQLLKIDENAARSPTKGLPVVPEPSKEIELVEPFLQMETIGSKRSSSQKIIILSDILIVPKRNREQTEIISGPIDQPDVEHDNLEIKQQSNRIDSERKP